ncbi:unnamed protein product [Vitrella brassicaformis CCMP3155]|uniref:Rab-GAP TBC domain-containing protein n=3 Tax=Vitrella brassicaformis TaxID=1169539 RepID=A0A0G4ERA7_VITBC|nr:unnamed protein product [Vitrella brassicaformis CCMP3155]|eukprot:CEM00793.1 unnamed protein product [Vitrella brassicaformis CCMP3155]
MAEEREADTASTGPTDASLDLDKWLKTLGVKELTYQKTIEAHEEERRTSGKEPVHNVELIAEDVKRTRQHYALFQAQETKDELQAVLAHYCALRRKDIHYYKQGLHEVCAPFLFLAPRPSRPQLLGCLDMIIRNMGARIFHEAEMSLSSRGPVLPLQLMCQVTRLLLQFHDPELSKALDNQEIMPDLYLVKWYTSLYTSCFRDVHLLLALWRECLKHQPSYTMVYFIALGWLTMHRERLLSHRGSSDNLHHFLLRSFDADCSPPAAHEEGGNGHDAQTNGHEYRPFPLTALVKEALKLRDATPLTFLTLLRDVSGRPDLLSISKPSSPASPDPHPAFPVPSPSSSARSDTTRSDDLTTSSNSSKTNPWALLNSFNPFKNALDMANGTEGMPRVLIEESPLFCLHIEAQDIMASVEPCSSRKGGEGGGGGAGGGGGGGGGALFGGKKGGGAAKKAAAGGGGGAGAGGEADEADGGLRWKTAIVDTRPQSVRRMDGKIRKWPANMIVYVVDPDNRHSVSQLIAVCLGQQRALGPTDRPLFVIANQDGRVIDESHTDTDNHDTSTPLSSPSPPHEHPGPTQREREGGSPQPPHGRGQQRRAKRRQLHVANPLMALDMSKEPLKRLVAMMVIHGVKGVALLKGGKAAFDKLLIDCRFRPPPPPQPPVPPPVPPPRSTMPIAPPRGPMPLPAHQMVQHMTRNEATRKGGAGLMEPAPIVPPLAAARREGSPASWLVENMQRGVQSFAWNETFKRRPLDLANLPKPPLDPTQASTPTTTAPPPHVAGAPASPSPPLVNGSLVFTPNGFVDIRHSADGSPSSRPSHHDSPVSSPSSGRSGHQQHQQQQQQQYQHHHHHHQHQQQQQGSPQMMPGQGGPGAADTLRVPVRAYGQQPFGHSASPPLVHRHHYPPPRPVHAAADVRSFGSPLSAPSSFAEAPGDNRVHLRVPRGVQGGGAVNGWLGQAEGLGLSPRKVRTGGGEVRLDPLLQAGGLSPRKAKPLARPPVLMQFPIPPPQPPSTYCPTAGSPTHRPLHLTRPVPVRQGAPFAAAAFRPLPNSGWDAMRPQEPRYREVRELPPPLPPPPMNIHARRQEVVYENSPRPAPVAASAAFAGVAGVAAGAVAPQRANGASKEDDIFYRPANGTADHEQQHHNHHQDHHHQNHQQLQQEDEAPEIAREPLPVPGEESIATEAPQPHPPAFTDPPNPQHPSRVAVDEPSSGEQAASCNGHQDDAEDAAAAGGVDGVAEEDGGEDEYYEYDDDLVLPDSPTGNPFAADE